jgi:hypothetical protein
MALPEELDRQMDVLRDQGWVPLHLHELGADCDERCVPRKVITELSAEYQTEAAPEPEPEAEI